MSKNREIRAHRAVIVTMIVVLAGLAIKANAQNPSNYYEEDPRTFYGGLLGGLNFSQVDGDSYAGYHKVGFNAGGIMYVQLDDHVAASMEILYSQKGSRGHLQQKSGVGTIITKYRIDLDYAEVPIQINYFDRRKSHFGGGFSYSQLISSKEIIEANGMTVDPSAYPFKKMDINFIVGGNLHLVSGLFLNLRFQYSLLTIRKDYVPGYGKANQFNNMWTLRLMYLF